MDLRQKLELVIEMAPKLRAAGVHGRIETEEIDFSIAPPEPQPAALAQNNTDEDREVFDPTDLRPKALRDRERENKRERGY